MAVGLRMRVVNTQDGSVLDRTFDRSPVRIGRATLNELPIQAPFVSQYHAVVEFDANRITLRDLGSTNGTALRTAGRVPPNTPIDLAQHNFEFAIVSLWFQLSPVMNVAPAPAQKKREGTILSMDVGELQKMLASGTGVPGVPAAAAPAGGQPNQKELEGVALQALRDLAASYVPQRGQLDRVVDVVAFAQKMQDVLDVFFKCFLPLRDGHKQFKSQMDIKNTRTPRENLNAARAVEMAREPRELASRVLDWADPSNEGSRAIESTFAEVMVHQVAMLNGVMSGVRSLLAKLAPASIEAEVGNPRRRAAGGMQLGPFRYKTLWELYLEIYGDFAEDEKQAFMLIFGSEFVHAYTELAGEERPGAAPGGAPAPHAFGQPGPPPPHAFGPPGGQLAPAFAQQPAAFPQPNATRSPSGAGPVGSRPGPGVPPPGPVAPPPMVTHPPVTHPPGMHPPAQQPPSAGGQQPAPPPMVSQPGGPWTGGSWPGGGQRR
ncbi:MAG TPA: type VI secretion system-associated FHA domain protein [Polyangiaceae bacterium]